MSLKEKKHIKIIILSVFILAGICGATLIFAQQKSQKNAAVNSFQYMKTINSVFDFVEKNYVDEVDSRVLYEGALKGMLDALGDPYTLYLDSDYMRDLQDTTVGSFGGVGLSISKPTESTPDKPAYVEVASPMEDSPGAKAGIQAGDYIIAVEGRPTPEMTMNEVLGVLRGEIGTPVTITILRGKNMRFDVKLIRDRIEVPTVKYGMIENTEIGYVRIIEFTSETPKRFQDALDFFQNNSYKSMIIDLRDNPGGLITSVVNVADKFIDKGVIVSTRSRLVSENAEYSATKEKTTIKQKVPVVVLINKGSASASEILSGFLKDYKMGYLIGERTYGKGSVQQVIPLSDIDGIKITMARYYTPSEVNIDKIGIPPDKEVINIQPFTKEQEESYIKVIQDGIIDKTVEANPNMSEQQIKIKAEKIAGDYNLEERLIRKLIRNQVLRTQPTPLYDLDFDLQLNSAIDVLNGGQYQALVKKTKTLKQLQLESEEKENK